MFGIDDVALATLMQQLAAQQAAQATAMTLVPAATSAAIPAAAEAVMPAALQAAQSVAPAATELMQPVGMEAIAPIDMSGQFMQQANAEAAGMPLSGQPTGYSEPAPTGVVGAGAPSPATAPLPPQQSFAGPAPGASEMVSAGQPQGIPSFMQKASDELVKALPGAALSGVGTGLQQMALANAEEEKARAEEEAQRKLLDESEREARAIIDWGTNNLSPDAIEANRASSEEETLKRLLNNVNEEDQLLGIKGNVSAEYLKSLADNTARVAQDARNYAGLTAKGLSWGNNKTSLSALDLARKLSDSAAAKGAIYGSAQKKITGISPNSTALMGGSALQAVAPALNKL